jgi:NAD(P)-dependent dehydrogenase (short-subunit alcohol dehydrogenase family)
VVAWSDLNAVRLAEHSYRSCVGGRFSGKHVIVTGGSRGIGYTIAEAFLSDGANVLVVGRSAGALEHAVASLKETSTSVAHFPADVCDPGAVAELVGNALSRWPRIDVLVNNAGLFRSGPFLEVDQEHWEEVLSLNLTGPFLLSQRVAGAMKSAGGGAIVNVASTNAHGIDGVTAAYSTAKAGLRTLTKAIAVELGEYGIRCNSVSPTYVSTEKLAEVLPPALHAYVTRRFDRIPLRRAVTPGEVARACLFLASDEASGVTGCDLLVDGGTVADLYVGASLPALD